MKKIEIKEEVNSFSLSDLDGRKIFTPEDAWNILIGNIDRDKYKSFCLDYDYGYNEYCSGTASVYGIRDETDDEYTSRLAKESKLRAAEKIRKDLEKIETEKKERALLEELKKKYE